MVHRSPSQNGHPCADPWGHPPEAPKQESFTPRRTPRRGYLVDPRNDAGFPARRNHLRRGSTTLILVSGTERVPECRSSWVLCSQKDRGHRRRDYGPTFSHTSSGLYHSWCGPPHGLGTQGQGGRRRSRVGPVLRPRVTPSGVSGVK